MKNLNKAISNSLALILVLSVGLMSCDGGGGGGGGGQPSGQTTTIIGNVESVVAMAPQNNKSSMLAKIKDFFSLSKTANAQDDQIIVTIVVDDQEFVVPVEPNGDFVAVVPISFSGNNVTLVFESDGDDESIVIFVPPVDAVIIVVLVNFQGNDAEVVELEFEGPLRCENATISLVAEAGEDIEIHGNGGACVLTAGNCDLTFDAENVIFQDCNSCFDTRGNSVLEIFADEDIICEGAGDCVISRGTSSTSLFAGDEISLDCIDARGNVEVTLDALSCIIGDIFTVGNATVDTSGCANIGI